MPEDFLYCKKTPIIFFLLFAGVLSCFSSCAARAAIREDRRPYAYLTDSSKYFLLPPGSIENSMDMSQRLSASYEGRQYFFNAWVKADEAGMDMILLNELGASMGELSYRNDAVSFSSPVFPKSLPPEYIVADFQLCFYNTPALRQALEGCGLSFEDTEADRRVLQKGTVIIEIEKTRNTVALVNHLRGYRYTLEGDFE
jgi:hypothetical protein